MFSAGESILCMASHISTGVIIAVALKSAYSLKECALGARARQCGAVLKMEPQTLNPKP